MPPSRRQLRGGLTGLLALVLSIGVVQPWGSAHANVSTQAVTTETVSTARYPLGIDVDQTGNIFLGYIEGPGTKGLYVVPKATGTMFGQNVTAGQEHLLFATTAIQGVVVDAQGDILFSRETNPGELWALTETTRTIYGQSVVAHTPTRILTSNFIRGGLALDDTGNLFSANKGGGGVGVLPAVTEVLGQGGLTVNTPAQLTAVELDWEGDVAVDRDGNLFVTQWWGSPKQVLVVPVNSGVLYGENVLRGVSSVLTSFSQPSLGISPSGIDVDDNGILYVVSWFGGIVAMAPTSTTVLGDSVVANEAKMISGTSSFADQGIAVDPTGGVISGANAATVRIQGAVPPTISSVSPATGSVDGGDTVTISGSNLSGVSTVIFGGSAVVSLTVIDSSTVQVTTPANVEGAVDVVVSGMSGSATAVSAFTYVSAPSQPVPAIPASAPINVAALTDASEISVQWQPPTQHGSFPITHYLVTSSPSGGTCLATTTECVVNGLTHDVEYTFTVQALNGAGWGARSEPSNAVTPMERTIMTSVTESTVRGRPGIIITGTTTGLAPGTPLQAWIRFSARSGYEPLPARITVDESGGFSWQRRLSRPATIYVSTTDSSVVGPRMAAR